jgi:phosphatidylinositol alpha-1,6-mannosyltransferase
VRVLLLTTDVGECGGVQYAGRLLLRTLRDYRHGENDVSLVTIKGAAIGQDRGQPDKTFAGEGSRVRTAFAVRRLLKCESWDLLVLGHINLASLMLAVARNRLPPSLAFIHGLEAWGRLSGFRRQGLMRIDRLLYNSRNSRDRSLSANPWLSRLESSNCPLGLMPFENVTSSHGDGNGFRSPLQPQGIFALSIGRMTKSEAYKGHEEMIRVWPAVERERPELRLVIMGDGDDRPRLQSLARHLAVNVEFLGCVDDFTRDAYLSACRCFCLPSRGEGFGLVYLEAMRAGKPVLAGSRDAGGEVVVDGVTGRAVDAGNSAELLQGILDVSGPRAEAMGLAGFQRFQDHFSYERFLARFSQQIDAVCGDRNLAAL